MAKKQRPPSTSSILWFASGPIGIERVERVSHDFDEQIRRTGGPHVDIMNTRFPPAAQVRSAANKGYVLAGRGSDNNFYLHGRIKNCLDTSGIIRTSRRYMLVGDICRAHAAHRLPRPHTRIYPRR
jgi:hypothetical protein